MQRMIAKVFEGSVDSQEKIRYQDEIPWGVCRLLQLFQGTNYQDI